MIFDLKTPSKLGPEEVKSIIGHREDMELDFKGIAYSKLGENWQIQLLKDVVSFANANGGYIFVGVLEKEKNGIAKEIINIPNAQGEAQSMYDTCNRFIVEKFTENELVIVLYWFSGNRTKQGSDLRWKIGYYLPSFSPLPRPVFHTAC